MPAFGLESMARLATCDERIKRVFERVVLSRDCTVLEGHRGAQAQARAVAEGLCTEPWPSSPYNRYPSLAIRVAPHPYDPTDLPAIHGFAGFVQGVAEIMATPLYWGGPDRPTHFEII